MSFGVEKKQGFENFLFDKAPHPVTSSLETEKNLKDRIKNLVQSKSWDFDAKTSSQVFVCIKNLATLDEALRFCEENQITLDSLHYCKLLELHAPWSVKKYLFKHIPLRQHSRQTHNLFIELASENQDLKLAQKTFGAVKNPDYSSFSHIIEAEGKLGSLERVQKLFETAENLGLVNDFVYNVYINSLVEKGVLKEAKIAFLISNLKYEYDQKSFTFELQNLLPGTAIAALSLFWDERKGVLPRLDSILGIQSNGQERGLLKMMSYLQQCFPKVKVQFNKLLRSIDLINPGKE